MEDLESRLDAREMRSAVAAVLGAFALIAGAALSGPLAAICFAVGAPLVGYAACTTFCPNKADACPAQPCWQEGTATESPAEPQQTITLHTQTPNSVRRWLERVEHEAHSAKRGR